jgi:prepilin-type N-terminal cleavage/methylation domain-containing protein
MKKYKIQNTFVPKPQQTMEGFTLIELLMVVALIAILSTMILIMLDSGREKAEVNRYVSYATQMYRLTADSVAAGQFDSSKIGITGGNTAYCLGEVDYDCGKTELAETGTSDASRIYKALTYLTKFPVATDENSLSPYSPKVPSANRLGVYMQYKPTTSNQAIRITMPVGTNDDAFVQRVCNSMNWTKSNKDCYIDIKLHSRL